MSMNSFKGQDVFIWLYLRNTLSGYEIDVLGKNGEPKPNMAINLVLNHRYVTKQIEETLQTDENGKIHLGRLVDITHI